MMLANRSYIEAGGDNDHVAAGYGAISC